MFKKRRNKLTAEEMVRWEREVDKKCVELYGRIDHQELANVLKLKIVKESDAAFDDNIIAELAPPEGNDREEEFVGRIRIRESCQDPKFPILHEIMHYILDVGGAGEVTAAQAKDIAGSEKTYHEQEIDYAAAAYAIPLEEIKDRLDKYDKTKPQQDLLKIVDSLNKKYNCGEEAVIRRIKEARKLEWHDEQQRKRARRGMNRENLAQ